MDWTALYESLVGSLGSTLPTVGGALLILVVGWFIAILVRAGVRSLLGFASLNDRIKNATGDEIDVAGAVASGAYYLVLLLAAVAFFNTLELNLVSGSLQGLVDQVLAFLPKLVAGGVLLLVAWILATVLRSVATRALAATSLDEKVASQAEMAPISQSLGNVLYWLVFLLFLPAILDALEMEGLLAPVQSMVDDALGVLPNLVAAGVIAAVGWFVARILRDLVSNLLAAAGADGLGERAGLSGNTTLSGLVGLVVYVLVFVPALIAALNVLEIEAISGPATDMLGTFMAALPNLFAAAVILAVTWMVAGFVAELVTNLLAGVGFDALPEKLGVGDAFGADAATPSQLAGKLIVFFAMLFAVVEAAGRLGFDQVSGLVATLIAFGSQVLLGSVIIAAGFFIANVARDAVVRVSGDGSESLAGLARFAIMGLVVAMGLRAMGLADDIVNMAFGLTLGAIAVAVALSFGLGGREAAGKQMEHWLSRLRGEN